MQCFYLSIEHKHWKSEGQYEMNWQQDYALRNMDIYSLNIFLSKSNHE